MAGLVHPTEASFSILLEDKKDTDFIVKEMEKKKDQYPDAHFEVSTASFMMGGASTNITIDVVGENIAELENVATAIKEKVQNIGRCRGSYDQPR